MYKNLTDEKILELYKQGDDNALNFLLKKYKLLASKISRSYFLIGAETEDILQEAMLGLYAACRNYKQNNNSSFKTFATLCITRAVQSAVKIANRQKYKMLNQSYSLSNQGAVVFDEHGDNGEEACIYIPSSILEPEDVLLKHEREIELEKTINTVLTQKEKNVLNLYLKGLSYAEIANVLNENIKSIDNAIARTKKKLQKVLK